MAVGAGVAVNRGAHPAGDAGQRFQSLQAPSCGEVHQVLQFRAGLDRHARAFGADGGGPIAQHHASKAGVGCHQVGAAADDGAGQAGLARHLQRGSEGRDGRGIHQPIGPAADSESRVARQRRAA